MFRRQFTSKIDLTIIFFRVLLIDSLSFLFLVPWSRCRWYLRCAESSSWPRLRRTSSHRHAYVHRQSVFACQRIFRYDLHSTSIWFILFLFLRFHRWSSFQHRWPSFPTMRVRSLASHEPRSLRWHKQDPINHQWHPQTQGLERRHPAPWWLLWQIINATVSILCCLCTNSWWF